jgi:prepilin peptidase CpaA
VAAPALRLAALFSWPAGPVAPAGWAAIKSPQTTARMSTFLLERWPLLVMSAGLIAGAVIDGWKFKVPNWLTFPLIITGWLVGLWFWLGWPPAYSQDTSNRFAASLLGTLVAWALLFWIYLIGGMGAGDVKLLMGFGSWMGAYYGYVHGTWFIVYAFFIGVLIGGVIALVMMIPNFKTHMQTVGEIFKDFATSGFNLGKIAQKAEERKPRWLRLPYGVPLTIGFLTYVWLRECALLPNFINPYP